MQITLEAPTRWEEIYRDKGIVQKEPVLVVKKLPEMLEHRLTEPLRILDVGCGTGRHLLYLGILFQNAHIVGIDNSPSALAHAQKSIHMLNLDERVLLLDRDFDLDIADLGRFDTILATLAIHHGYSQDIASRWRRLDALLNRNGIFVFSAPSTKDPRFLTGREVEPNTRIDTAQEDGDLPHHFFDKAELLALFSGYKPLFITHVQRPMVMAEGLADNIEAIFLKESSGQEAYT